MLFAFVHPPKSHAPLTNNNNTKCDKLLFNFVVLLWFVFISMLNLNGTTTLAVALDPSQNVSILTHSGFYNNYGNVNEEQQFSIPSSPRIICEDEQTSMSFTCPQNTRHSTKTKTTTTKKTTTSSTKTTSTTTRPKVTKTTEKRHLSILTVTPLPILIEKKTSSTHKTTTFTTQSYLNKKLGKMKLGSVTESTLMKMSNVDSVEMSHHNTFGGVFNNEVNNVLVIKDNLVKKLVPTGQIFCTFDEELHIKNSDPICRKPEWRVGDNEASMSIEYHHGRNPPSRHKRSVVGQKEPLTLEERHQLERLYGNQFNLEAAETVKAMGMAENNHWIPPHHQNLQRERRFQPSRWDFENKNYYNNNRRQKINSPMYTHQNEEQLLLHQAEQEEVDERHLELEQGTFPLMPNNNNNEKYWTQTKYHQRPPNNIMNVNNNNNDDIILNSKSKPELQVLLKSILEKLQESKKQELNSVHHEKELQSSNNTPNRKIRHSGPSSNIMETRQQQQEQEEEEKDAEEECSLYGTWLSPLAGVAIVLHPIGQTIKVTLENLPGVKNPLVSKSWIGTTMISPVSPTTLTLIFQEGQLTPKQSLEESPETAIFVGQCIYCVKGGTAIQGSWTIFTRKRNCLPSSVTRNMTGHYGNSELLYRKT